MRTQVLKRNSPLPKKKFTDINVTPFVDVVLVLLIIFMITAPNMESGIKLKLPKIIASTLETTEAPLVLSINKKMHIYIEDTKVPMKNLDYRIKLLLKQKKNKSIFLKADKNVKYGFVTKIINNIKKAGINKIALITKMPDEEKEVKIEKKK